MYKVKTICRNFIKHLQNLKKCYIIDIGVLTEICSTVKIVSINFMI